MARVILSNNETFTVFNSTASVEGGTGTETLLIGGTSSAVTVSQSIERVDLKGNVGDYTYQAAGNQVKVYSSGALVATITAQDDSNGTQVAFADGSAYLTVSALNSAALGGAAIGTTAVAISSSQVGSSFDTTTKSGSTALGGATGNQTFTLTTGANNFTGGTGNDYFDASTVSTLNSFDTIDGGAGTDSLFATLAGSTTVYGGISNVEALTFSVAADSASIDLLGSSGYTSVQNNGSAGALKIANISSTAAAAQISNTTKATEFVWQASAVSGTADAITLTLSNVTGNAGVTIAGVETVNVVSAGTTNSVDLSAVTAATVKVSGAQALTVSALSSSTKTFDWSSSTATSVSVTPNAVTATLTGGSGNDSISASAVTASLSVSAGAGNDTIAAGTLAVGDSIDGGTGTDVLTTTYAGLTAFTTAATTVTNVEQLTVTDALTSTAGSIANLSSAITTLNLGTAITTATGLGGGGTITGNTALTVNLGATQASNRESLGGTVGFTSSVANTTDTLTINNLAIDSVTGLNINVFGTQSITDTGYETVTINTGSVASSVAGTPLNTINVLTVNPETTTSAATVNLTGSNTIAVTSLVTTSTGKLTISGSGLTPTTGTVMSVATNASGASGTQSITGSAGNDSITVTGAYSATIDGGSGNDTISSGTGNDSILGGAGNDSIAASTGNNYVDGDVGNDTITAGSGNDTILGAAGDDSITGGGGNDSLEGGEGNNTLIGGSANDTIKAGSGNDSITGGDGNNTIDAGNGNNTIVAGAGADSITSGDGNDTITTGNGNNTVNSGSGNDTITAGTGIDVLNGGAGDDTYIFSTNLTSQDVIADTSGTDTLTASFSSLVGSPQISGIEVINLSLAGTNTIDASSFADATKISITNVQTADSLAITGLVAGTELGLGFTGATTFGGTLTFGLRTNTSADSVKVNLNNTATAGLSGILATSDSAGNIETVTLAVGSTVGGTLGVANLATPTITVTGGVAAGTLNLRGASTNTTLSSTTTAVNASGFAGVLNAAAGSSTGTAFTVTGSGGNDTLVGGSGNDSFTLQTASSTSALSVVGGTGTDTLTVTMASGATSVNTGNLDSIENINLILPTAATSFAPTAMSSAQGLALTNLVVTGGSSTSTLTLGSSSSTTNVIGGAQASTGSSSLLKVDTSGFLGAADVTVLLDGLNLGRTIAGGSTSSDVLRYTNTNATGITAGTVSGFESIFITTASSDLGSHNLANVSGVNTITVLGSNSYALTQLGAGIALKIGDDSTGGTGLTDGKTLSATWTTTSSASDSVTVNLGKASAATSGITLTLPAIETITLNQSALANGSAFALAIADTNTNSVTINATGGLAGRDLTFIASGLQSNVVTLNGSTFAGNLLMSDSSRVGTTAMSITGGSGNDSIIMKNASDTLTGGSGTDTLKIAATASGAFTFDLSSSTDQVTTWNGFSNSAAQSGFENIDASTLVGSVGIGVIASAASGSSIIGSVNNDTIYGGAGNDSITGAGGADAIDISSGGSDTIAYTATGQTYSSATQILNGLFLGTTATPGDLQVDVITGLARGDTIKLYTGVNTSTGFNIGFSTTGLVGQSITAGADPYFQMSKGNYIGTGLWTFSTTGSDVLFQWDSQGSTSSSSTHLIESVVLVGAASSFTGITANSAGVILFT